MTHPLDRYSDIHSHDSSRALRGDTVVNIDPGTPMLPGGTYSVGIHPWNTDTPITLSQLKQLVRDARDPRVVAIGEAGFDRLRGGSADIQSALFDFHARLAQRLGKPLIIHCVRAYDSLLAATRRHRPSPDMWIVHGYNRNATLARQLVDAGLHLSFNLARPIPQAISDSIPATYIHRETDDNLK